jgi:hypothetical protein
MYLDSLEFINFSLSINFNASLPQIGRYRIGLGTLIGNFGELFKLTFHNWMPIYWTPHMIYGETLYCIQPKESTKNLNRCILICPTNILGPFFKQFNTQDLKFKIS